MVCSWTIVKLHNSHGSLLIKAGDMFNNVIIQKWSINKYSGYQKCTELRKQSRLPYPVRFIGCGVCPDISTSEGAADSGGGHLRNRHWQLNESSAFTASRNTCCSVPGTNDFIAPSECVHRPELPHEPERKNTTGQLQEPELGIPGISCGNVRQRRRYFPIPSA